MLISPWSKVHRSWMIWMLVRRTLLVLRLLIYFWDSFSILMFEVEVEVEVEVTDYYSNCCCVRWSDVYVWYFLLMNNLASIRLARLSSIGGRSWSSLWRDKRKEQKRRLSLCWTDGRTDASNICPPKKAHHFGRKHIKTHSTISSLKFAILLFVPLSVPQYLTISNTNQISSRNSQSQAYRYI